MRKRWLALAMAAVMSAGQLLGAAPAVMAEELVPVEEVVETGMAADPVAETVDVTDAADEAAIVDEVIAEDEAQDAAAAEEAVPADDQIAVDGLNIADSDIVIADASLVEDPELAETDTVAELESMERDPDCFVYGLRDEENNYSWIFPEGDSVEFSVDLDKVEELIRRNGNEEAQPENFVVQWELGQWNDEGQYRFIGVFEEDNDTATLTSEWLKEHGVTVDDYSIDAIVYDTEAIDDNYLIDWGFGLGVWEPEYNYNWDPSNDIAAAAVLGWETHIEPTVDGWIRDADHPDGEGVSVPVKSVEAQMLEGNPGAISVEGDPENGWDVRAEAYCRANIVITCEALDGQGTKTFEREIQVAREAYSLGIEYPDNNSQLHPGETLTISTSLFKDIENEDGMDVEDYTLRVSGIQDGEERADVSVNGHNINVTGKADMYGSVRFTVEALVGGAVVTNERVNVNVTDNYWVMELGDYDTAVALNETFVVENVKVLHHWIDDEGIMQTDDETANVTFEWDEGTLGDNWTVGAPQGSAGIPALTRNTPYGSGVRLVASYGDEDNVADHWFDFDGLDFGEFDLEYSYGRPDQSYLFEGEPLTLTLTGDLPDGAEVQWVVGKYDETIDDLRPVDEYVSYTEDPDGRSITLTVTGDINALREDRGDSWINVDAHILLGESEIDCPGTGIEVVEQECYIADWNDAWHPAVIQWQGGFGYDPENGGYAAPVRVRNSANPWGEVYTVVFDGANADDTDVVKIEANPEDVILFTAVGGGSTTIHLENIRWGNDVDTDKVPELHEGDLDFGVEVNWEKYYFSRIWTEGSNCDFTVLPGGTMKIQAILIHEEYDEDTDELDGGRVNPSEYTLSFEGDSEDFTVSPDGTIKAGSHPGGGSVKVYAASKTKDSDGDPLFEVEEWRGVDITDQYYGVESETIYVQPGETKQVTPVLKSYTTANPAGTVVPNVTFECEADFGLASYKNQGNGISVTARTEEYVETVETLIWFTARDSAGEYLLDGTLNLTICKHNLTTTTRPATCTAAGSVTTSCSECDYKEVKTTPAAGHKWSAWKTVTEATISAPAKQQRTCSVCKATETRSSGSAAKPVIKLSAKKVPMKVGQSTTAVKVTKMANGDKVKSWKSSNTKVVKVTKKGKMTAKKAGTATITVTLKSGKSAKVKVTVQNASVTTTKITGVKKKLTLKKGKSTTLAPVLTPVTSQDKITYTSSNAKVVKVSKSGKLTAKKAGTATITVQSGKKKVTCKVTVK